MQTPQKTGRHVREPPGIARWNLRTCSRPTVQTLHECGDRRSIRTYRHNRIRPQQPRSPAKIAEPQTAECANGSKGVSLVHPGYRLLWVYGMVNLGGGGLAVNHGASAVCARYLRFLASCRCANGAPANENTRACPTGRRTGSRLCASQVARYLTTVILPDSWKRCAPAFASTR